MALSTPPRDVTQSNHDLTHRSDLSAATDKIDPRTPRRIRVPTSDRGRYNQPRYSRAGENRIRDGRTVADRDDRPRVVRLNDDDADVPRYRRGTAAVELETVVVTPKQVAAAMRSLPRTSAAAVTALVSGMTAAFAVATGMFAGPGIALAAIAVVSGMAGEAATDRRRVVGKGIARLGMALGVVALILGLLVVVGLAPWGTDANALEPARDWLAARLPWLFPGR